MTCQMAYMTEQAKKYRQKLKCCANCNHSNYTGNQNESKAYKCLNKKSYHYMNLHKPPYHCDDWDRDD